MRCMTFARDLSGGERRVDGTELTVERYSHSVFGGPLKATIAMKARDKLAAWECAELLRCPVEIWTAQGECVWWGYIAEVQLSVGMVTVSISIDTLANQVAVIGAKQTAWSADAASVAVYGTKQLLQTLSGASSDLALNARDRLLEEKKKPAMALKLGQSGTGFTGKFLCRGWYSTLAWKYYADAPADVDTGNQIHEIATSAGQFFTAVSTITAGVVSSSGRDGKALASAEMLELLKAGTANKRRMLAQVNQARAFSTTEEPAYSAGAAYIIGEDGVLRDPSGLGVRGELCQVGMWVRMREVIPASVDMTWLSDPSIFFVDECEYQVEGRLAFTARNVPNPWALGRPVDG